MPDAPIITGVDFVSLGVADLARARSFYSDVLGLHESVVREPFNVEYQVGATTVSILEPTAMGLGDASPNPHHLALHVEDFDAACAALAARGVAFSRDHLDTGVCHMAFLEDPDGNALMLHHRYAPKETAS